MINSIKEILAPIKRYAGIYLGALRPARRDRLLAQRDFYLNFINTGDIVFDIGANIGDKTEAFLEARARVISVEPQKRCVDIMKRRFAGNNRVTIVNKGVSDKAGTLKLSVCDRSDTISTFSDRWKDGRFKGFKWNRKEEVEVTTLDELIQKHGRPVG